MRKEIAVEDRNVIMKPMIQFEKGLCETSPYLTGPFWKRHVSVT